MCGKSAFLEGGMEELFPDIHSKGLFGNNSPQKNTTFMYLYIFRSLMEEFNNWGLQGGRW